jgi:hypothetical protein
VKRGNITAFNTQQASPVSEIEPILCEFCIQLAKMETKIANKISVCKQLWKLADVDVLGIAWYRGFMHCYKSKIQEI